MYSQAKAYATLYDMSPLQKLIAENAESAEIFFNNALRTLRSLR
jgi:hypothetical protein